MIKSLLDDDEDRNEEEEPRSGFLKRSFGSNEMVSIDLSSESEDEPAAPGESEEEIRRAIVLGPSSELSDELLELEPRPSPPADTEGDLRDPIQAHERRASELERKLHEIEDELRRERESLRVSRTALPEDESRADQVPGAFGEGPEYRDQTETPAATPGPVAADVPSFGSPPETESSVETFRKSGMAWSAAIALFGSVVFMLVLGWFADLLMGTSPWGVAAGVVLGSVIGFIQFFRITSQILKPSKSDFEKVSLKSEEATEQDADG